MSSAWSSTSEHAYRPGTACSSAWPLMFRLRPLHSSSWDRRPRLIRTSIRHSASGLLLLRFPPSVSAPPDGNSVGCIVVRKNVGDDSFDTIVSQPIHHESGASVGVATPL